MLCSLGITLFYGAGILDSMTVDRSHKPLPKSVEIAWAFCAVAYFCNLLSVGLKCMFARTSTRRIHSLGCYIALLATSAYFSLWIGWTSRVYSMKSLLYIPTRWTLYALTMPGIWTILSHISEYPDRRKLYVLWLNAVMLVAGGLATIPQLSWGHKCTLRNHCFFFQN